MPPLRLAQDYLVWHYTAGPVSLSRLVFEFLRFFRRLFAVSWRRRRATSSAPVVKLSLSSQVIKWLVSLLGFLLRSLLGFLGVVVLAIVVLIWPVALGLWLLTPFLIIIFWFVGFYLLFHL